MIASFVTNIKPNAKCLLVDKQSDVMAGKYLRLGPEKISTIRNKKARFSKAEVVLRGRYSIDNTKLWPCIKFNG